MTQSVIDEISHVHVCMEYDLTQESITENPDKKTHGREKWVLVRYSRQIANE